MAESIGLIEDAADLDAVATSAPSDSGVVCVPSFVGLGAPYEQPRVKATFEGLSLDSGAAEIVRAVLEGIAAQVAVLVRAAESDLGETIQVLRVDGGLTRSSVLMQRRKPTSCRSPSSCFRHHTPPRWAWPHSRATARELRNRSARDCPRPVADTSLRSRPPPPRAGSSDSSVLWHASWNR